MRSVAPSSPALTLEQLARICQTGRADALRRPLAQATGYAQLDDALPGGGLPVGALTEILPQTEGIGELRVVMPALAQLTRNQRYVAFVEPPYIPYPPALAQHSVRLEQIVMLRKQTPSLSLWASEQMLRCSAFGAVLLWSTAVNDKALRRLQLAAEAGGNLAIVYRPATAARMASPAALRLALHADNDGLRIEIKKCRGGQSGQMVNCVFDTHSRTTPRAV